MFTLDALQHFSSAWFWARIEEQPANPDLKDLLRIHAADHCSLTAQSSISDIKILELVSEFDDKPVKRNLNCCHETLWSKALQQQGGFAFHDRTKC